MQELRYLLKDKPVEVTVELTPAQVEVAETAATIVLSNLIRNAFQHTWEGRVVIRQHHNQVSITNDNASGETSNEELGFGLGLQLTRRLCQRFGWCYKSEPYQQGYRVELTLGKRRPSVKAAAVTAS